MKTLLEYKCPCCGGSIQFDAGLQKLKCPYCDTEFDPEALRCYDEELKSAPREAMDWSAGKETDWTGSEKEELRTYICQSCGGEILTDANTAATLCPYCDSPVALADRLRGMQRPDYVIPFCLDREAAIAGFRQHLKGKRLLPKVFRAEAHIKEVKGIYAPFWLFRAEADADIHYHATNVRTWSDSNYIYTKTSHFSVHRSGTLRFAQVPVDGSQKLDDALMESLEPYDFSRALPFQTAYLAGFLADRYDVSAEQSTERANQRIRKSTEDAFEKTVHGYDTVRPKQTAIQLKDNQTSYAFYPVWLLTTEWKGKRYLFAMNGQTGKFVGDLPINKAAWCRWFFGLTGLVGGLIYLIAYLFWLL